MDAQADPVAAEADRLAADAARAQVAGVGWPIVPHLVAERNEMPPYRGAVPLLAIAGRVVPTPCRRFLVADDFREGGRLATAQGELHVATSPHERVNDVRDVYLPAAPAARGSRAGGGGGGGARGT